MARPLPDPDVCLGRAVHRLAGLDAERAVEFWDVRERTEHSPLRRRVDVAEKIPPKLRLLLLIEPTQRIAEEISLDRREAADLVARFELVRLLERVKRQQDAAVVRDILA